MKRAPLTLALLTSIAALGLGACHHDTTSPPPTSSPPPPSVPPPPPPPPPPATPTAAFTAPTTVSAGTPVAFDASTSSSPVNSKLSFGWTFGDGGRGGSDKQAHVFTTAGTCTVKLTVIDAEGRTASVTHDIVITAGPAPGPTVQTQVLVEDVADHLLPGVTAALVGGSATATSDAQGSLVIAVPTATSALIKLSKAGYADQFLPAKLPAGTGSDAYLEAHLIARELPLTLADAAAGGTLAGKDGAKITLAAGSLIDAAGNPATGAAQISLTPVDVTGASVAGFPGRFAGITPAAATTSIVSYGTVEFTLAQGATKLQLAPGRTATVEIPDYPNTKADGSPVAAGATVPLWSLDESTGLWVQEGTGTVVASAGSPSGLALSATVGHFSWWNMDDPIDNDYKPKPHCKDEGSGTPGSTDHLANATICNLLAQFDNGGGSGFSAGALAKLFANAAGAVQKPAYGGTFTVPIAGGQAIALPANKSMVLHGYALNGTWIGQKTVQGAATDTAEVVVPLHAVTSAPPDETITLPADITRAIGVGKTTRISFTTDGTKPVNIALLDGAGSLMEGHARLLQNGNELASIVFDTRKVVLSSTLLAAGTYVIEITNPGAQAGTFELVASYVLWATQGSVIPGLRAVDKVELVYDAQGRPVLMDAEEYFIPPDNNSYSVRLAFRRLVAGAWVAAADSVELGPNAGTGRLPCIGFALDRSGNPAYVQFGPTSNATVVHSWSGSAWQTVGPANGALPYPGGCVSPPDLAFDSANTPFVAYDATIAGVSGVAVLRYDGNAWVGVGPDNGRVTPANAAIGDHSMRLDSTGTPVVEWSVNTGTSPHSQAAYVVRYSATPTPAWTGIGSTNGLLPAATGTPYYFLQRGNLLLDANDRPLVVAQVTTDGGQSSPVALALWRFDGTQWSPSDVHAAKAQGAPSAAFGSRLGLTLTGAGDPLALWAETPYLNNAFAYYAQSWSGGAWHALGADDGHVDNPADRVGIIYSAARDPGGAPAVAFTQSTYPTADTPAGTALGVSVYTP